MTSQYVSELDTKRFGFIVAKVNNFDTDPAYLISKLKREGVSLIISKVPLQQIVLINKLEDLGFRIKDSQVTYRFNLRKQQIPMLENEQCIIRAFDHSDISSLKQMLYESFEGYGHYFANDRLDKKACTEIYVDWGIRSCLEISVADKVFVAECDGQTAGMLSFKKMRNEEGAFAAGGIGAVSAKFRGRDVFKQLAVAGMQWGGSENLEWEEHNVLTNNYAVNSSFSSLGFKVKNAFLTLHCWL